MNYGKASKIGRALAGFSQKDLAHLAGIDPSHVSLIESGKRNPSTKTVEGISRALGIPIHLFVLLAAEPGDLRTSRPEQLQTAARAIAALVLDDKLRKRKTHKTRRVAR